MKKICNTLVWLGAGTATNPSISFDEFERVIFIEARPEIEIEPDSLKPFGPKIEIHRVCLVSQDSNFKTFNVYNVEEVSSVNKPTGIYELYPNILKIAEETVDFEFVTEFLNDITLDKNTTVKLVVDIPDVSFSFLSDIIDSQVFDKVKQILLLAPRFKLFEKSADLVELLTMLEENVEIQYELDETDPDFPICHIEIIQSRFEKNRLAELELEFERKNHELLDSRESTTLLTLECEKLVAENKSLEDKLQGITTTLAEDQESLTTRNQQIEQLQTQALVEIAEKQDVEARLQEAGKTLLERSQQVELLETQAEVELAEKQGIEELLQSMTMLRDKQKHHHEENKAWAESLKQKLAASEEQRLAETALQEKTGNELIEKSQHIKKLQAEIESSLAEKRVVDEQLINITVQRDKLLIEIQHKSNRLDEDAVVNTRKLNEANKRIDQMLTMQNMNARMLQKSEADNANLRENIANKHDQIESMTALLTELHEKLKLASNFYEELTTQHPELIEKSVI